jgi:hypothetical protein
MEHDNGHDQTDRKPDDEGTAIPQHADDGIETPDRADAPCATSARQMDCSETERPALQVVRAMVTTTTTTNGDAMKDAGEEEEEKEEGGGEGEQQQQQETPPNVGTNDPSAESRKRKREEAQNPEQGKAGERAGPSAEGGGSSNGDEVKEEEKPKEAKKEEKEEKKKKRARTGDDSVPPSGGELTEEEVAARRATMERHVEAWNEKCQKEKAARAERAEAFRRERDRDPEQRVALTVVSREYGSNDVYLVPLCEIADDQAELLYQAGDRFSDTFDNDDRLQRLLGRTPDCQEGWKDGSESAPFVTARDIAERGRWAGFRRGTGKIRPAQRVGYIYIYNDVNQPFRA